MRRSTENGSLWQFLSANDWDGTLDWKREIFLPPAVIRDGNGKVWKHVQHIDLRRAYITTRNKSVPLSIERPRRQQLKYPITVDFNTHQGQEIFLYADIQGCWNSGGIRHESKSLEWD